MEMTDFSVYNITKRIDAELYAMNLVISACTKAKKGSVEARADSLPSGPIDRVGRLWLKTLEASRADSRAGDLYQGRSHAESRRAANDLDCPHFIVSAGLGLISADASVPNYAATILPGADNMLDRIEGSVGAHEWWRWLQANSPHAASLSDAIVDSEGLCLIALPKGYFAMLADELVGLPADAKKRLRLFCGSTVPEGLVGQQMPYDRRLSGPDTSIAGTESNFAARALRHFSREILPALPGGSTVEHATAVRAHLNAWRQPKRTAGKRLSDEAIIAILEDHWDAAAGRTTKLLRLLRDDLGIACEQGRFAALVRTMREARV
ncbi:hypothetical protein [Sphingomonas koreensis]|nr:hypothetical protein [Sphingomonas koreensis]